MVNNNTNGENTMKYSSYALRRQIMADPDEAVNMKFYALMVVEYTDWNTGIKRFDNSGHFTNWMKNIGERNGVDHAALIAAVLRMQAHGWATLDTKERILTLHQKPDEWEEVSA